MIHRSGGLAGVEVPPADGADAGSGAHQTTVASAETTAHPEGDLS